MNCTGVLPWGGGRIYISPIMLIPYQSLACGGLAAFICMTLSVRASGESIDFSKQILPILSDKCFICHDK